MRQLGRQRTLLTKNNECPGTQVARSSGTPATRQGRATAASPTIDDRHDPQRRGVPGRLRGHEATAPRPSVQRQVATGRRDGARGAEHDERACRRADRAERVPCEEPADGRARRRSSRAGEPAHQPARVPVDLDRCRRASAAKRHAACCARRSASSSTYGDTSERGEDIEIEAELQGRAEAVAAAGRPVRRRRRPSRDARQEGDPPTPRS